MTKSEYKDLFTDDDIVHTVHGLDCIPWDVIAEKLQGEYVQFDEWMRGQTCTVDGAYVCDVQNYFRKRDQGKLDAFPHGY